MHTHYFGLLPPLLRKKIKLSLGTQKRMPRSSSNVGGGGTVSYRSLRTRVGRSLKGGKLKCRAADVLTAQNGKETNGWRGNIPRDVRALLPIAGRKRSAPNDDTVIILKPSAFISYKENWTKYSDHSFLFGIFFKKRQDFGYFLIIHNPLPRSDVNSE